MTARTRHAPLVRLLALALALASLPLPDAGRAQSATGRRPRPDLRRALASRQPATPAPARKGAYLPQRGRDPLAIRARAEESPPGEGARRRPARPAPRRRAAAGTQPSKSPATSRAATVSGISAGTPLGRVLHTSQLSLVDPSGSLLQYVDQTGDLAADERADFDPGGGAYDVAVGRSGARYEVFTSVDDRGTATTSDDHATGTLVLALDTNADYVGNTFLTFDLGRDFGLPSAVSVVAGTSSAGREFVVVSSSGFFNSKDPDDPNNEVSPGVVLLVRDPLTGGFDNTRSRPLVRPGDDQLFNANALALLPTNDLVIADFQSNELRVVRDTDGDRVPDRLDPVPYYTFPLSEDAPLDVAANSRGVIFTHSAGADVPLLAVYDTDGDGYADSDAARVTGLSIDNNLVLHGLTVSRDGTVYIIEDAMGETDAPSGGGNGGVPRVDAFPDPALNGFLRDGAVFAEADDEFTQALSGLAFGVDASLGAVGRLALTNSASLRGAAAYGGLATITGENLTRGRSGGSPSEAAARGVRVTVEGLAVPVLSFSDARVHVYVPAELGAVPASVVVSVGRDVTAADDTQLTPANPGLFTVAQNGAGEAIALLVSGGHYTPGPFADTFGNQPAVVALFGTGWRNSLPVSVTIGGKPASVQYAGAAGGFPGLDQINAAVPPGASGALPVVVTTAGGASSRGDVVVSIR